MEWIQDKVYQWSLKAAYRLCRMGWSVFNTAGHGAYIAVWHGPKLLVIKNSYKTEHTVPGGGIKKGEAPLAAAVRELEEEVNIRVAPEALQFAGTFFSNHEQKRDTVLFYELLLDARPAVTVDNREVVWAAFLPRAEVLSLDLSPLVREYVASLGP